MMVPPTNPRRDLTDVRAMKALAHPLRQRIQQLLRRGPATATMLARELGESSASASYHLRQLARYGFVEEVPELSTGGRERWWRPVREDVRFPRYSQQDPEARAVLEQLNQLWSAEDTDALARFEAERDRMGAWGDALLYSRGEIRVAPEEVGEFFEAYIALLKRYQRPEDETPPETRLLLTRFLAFPAVEPTPGQDGASGTEPGKEAGVPPD